MPYGSAFAAWYDLLTGEIRNLNDIYLPPFAVKLFKKN